MASTRSKTASSPRTANSEPPDGRMRRRSNLQKQVTMRNFLEQPIKETPRMLIRAITSKLKNTSFVRNDKTLELSTSTIESPAVLQKSRTARKSLSEESFLHPVQKASALLSDINPKPVSSLSSKPFSQESLSLMTGRENRKRPKWTNRFNVRRQTRDRILASIVGTTHPNLQHLQSQQQGKKISTVALNEEEKDLEFTKDSIDSMDGIEIQGLAADCREVAEKRNVFGVEKRPPSPVGDLEAEEAKMQSGGVGYRAGKSVEEEEEEEEEAANDEEREREEEKERDDVEEDEGNLKNASAISKTSLKRQSSGTRALEVNLRVSEWLSGVEPQRKNLQRPSVGTMFERSRSSVVNSMRRSTPLPTGNQLSDKSAHGPRRSLMKLLSIDNSDLPSGKGSQTSEHSSTLPVQSSGRKTLPMSDSDSAMMVEQHLRVTRSTGLSHSLVTAPLSNSFMRKPHLTDSKCLPGKRSTVLSDSLVVEQPGKRSTIVSDSLFVEQPGKRSTTIVSDSLVVEQPGKRPTIVSDSLVVEQPGKRSTTIVSDSLVVEQPGKRSSLMSDSFAVEHPGKRSTLPSDSFAVKQPGKMSAIPTDSSVVKSRLNYSEQRSENKSLRLSSRLLLAGQHPNASRLLAAGESEGVEPGSPAKEVHSSVSGQHQQESSSESSALAPNSSTSVPAKHIPHQELSHHFSAPAQKLSLSTSAHRPSGRLSSPIPRLSGSVPKIVPPVSAHRSDLSAPGRKLSTSVPPPPGSLHLVEAQTVTSVAEDPEEDDDDRMDLLHMSNESLERTERHLDMTSPALPYTPRLPPKKTTPASTWRKKRATPSDDHTESNAAKKRKSVAVGTQKRHQVTRHTPSVIPRSLTHSIFQFFAGCKVTKEALEEVDEMSEVFWTNVVEDLETYSKHAGRTVINRSDVELLMKRQRFINENTSLNSLIVKYLALEDREALIPIARSGNRLE